MDTDSFILENKTSDVYEDMIDNIDMYDASNYKSDRMLFSLKNKKVIGKFKHELGGKVMSEFVGLRSSLMLLRILIIITLKGVIRS